MIFDSQKLSTHVCLQIENTEKITERLSSKQAEHWDRNSLTWRMSSKKLLVNDSKIKKSPTMNLSSQIAAKNLKNWICKLIHGVRI